MLKELLKLSSKRGYVVPVIEEQAFLKGLRDSRERERGVFHPSEICGEFCPREWVLCERDKSLYSNRRVSATLQMVFDVGHKLHDLMHEYLGDAGVLFGSWKCSCGCEWFGYKPSKCFNDVPGAKWTFNELPVVDKELLISGSTDGILDLKEGKYVFEFKSIHHDGFHALVGPLDHHKEQALIYVDVLDRNRNDLANRLEKVSVETGVDLTKEIAFARKPFDGAIIVYMNKNRQLLREFLVPKEVSPMVEFVSGKEVEKSFLDQKKDLIRLAIKHKNEGGLPDRLEVCSSPQAARAKKCLAVKQCFS